MNYTSPKSTISSEYIKENQVEINDQDFCKLAVEYASKYARPQVTRTSDFDTLSNAHISPQYGATMKVWLDGSRLTIQKDKLPYLGNNPCGQRSSITKFTRQSRRRLLYKISEINKSSLPVFCTLTYPKEYSVNPKKWKSDLDTLWKRIIRKYPQASCIWKLEPQKRGAPHYHLLIWGVKYGCILSFVPYAWYEVVGSGDIKHYKWHVGLLGNGNKPCVFQPDSWRGVMSYTAKYLGKVCDSEGWENPGRFWGVKSRKNLPWASMVRISIKNKEAFQILRLMRKVSGIKTRRYSSLTIFSNNPEFWFDNFDRMVST